MKTDNQTWQKVTESHPDIGDMCIVYWPPIKHPVSKRVSSEEVACFRFTGIEGDGDWNYDFLWGSGRFGHSGIFDYCLWAPFSLPKEEADSAKTQT